MLFEVEGSAIVPSAPALTRRVGRVDAEPPVPRAAAAIQPSPAYCSAADGQPSSPNVPTSPAFKKGYKDKGFYFELTEEFFHDADKLHLYIEHIFSL